MVKEEAVEQVEKYCYLGLLLDNKLAWPKELNKNNNKTDEIIKIVHSSVLSEKTKIIQSA